MKFCRKILETLSYYTVKSEVSKSHLGSNRYRVVKDTKKDTKTDTQTELP